MTQTVFRIGTVTETYSADDRTGMGAFTTGGRWNQKGTHLLYCADSRSLCCLETLVHIEDDPLPMNRFVVEYEIPDDIWDARQVLTHVTAPGGWDALPRGIVSMEFGTKWANAMGEAVLVVPSIIVPEESNILLNPLHPDMKRISAKIIRRWTYDFRLR